MNVYNCFENDNLEFIKEVQYQMYDYEIGYIFNIVIEKFIFAQYSSIYLSSEEKETFKNITTFDHRLVQSTHDNLAAVFRYKILQGEIQLELFELSEVECFFENIFIDTLFLKEIPPKDWAWCIKWHQFLANEIKSERYYPIIRNLSKALFVYHGLDDRELRWFHANEAAKLIEEIYTLPKSSVYK